MAMETQNQTKSASAYAYRNATGVMLLGFVFALFSLRVGGLDVLLDPVGWILVFNGVRPMEKPGGGVGPRAVLCLVLVAVSAVELFVKAPGVAILVLGLHAAGELIFFLSLIGLFRRILEEFQLKTAGIYFTVILVCNSTLALLLTLAFTLPSYFGVQNHLLVLLFSAFNFAVRLALLVALGWLLAQFVKKAKKKTN